MQWLIAFHIIAVVAWFAGLFYLPRLFVYHSQAEDLVGIERFKVMEQRLFYGIMTPAAIFTVGLGGYILIENWPVYVTMGWIHLKLLLVFFLLIYHGYCAYLISRFRQDRNEHSTLFYKWFNEIPTFFLISIVILAVVKPF